MSKYNFRNTYQVPAGQVVTVDTPQGERKYTGGQYVPPEQLGNARIASKEDKSKKGQAPEQPGEGWDEILQQFKDLDISNKVSLNRASYNIQQFLPLVVNTSSNKVTPACKFGTELTLANISNSLPALRDILQQIQLNIQLINFQDEPPIISTVVGKSFIKVGEISFKDNTIKYWEHESKPEDIMSNVTKYLGSKLGIFVIRYIYHLIDDYKVNQKDIEQKINQLQILCKRKINDFSSSHKGKPPEAGQDEELDGMMEQLKELSLQKQTIDVLEPLSQKLEYSVKKEGGVDKYVSNILSSNLREGTIYQFSKILSKCNSISLSGKNTFASAMERLAGTHPETIYSIKEILETLMKVNQESNEGG